MPDEISRAEMLRERETLLDEIEAVYATRTGLSEAIHEGGFIWIDALVRRIVAEKKSVDFLEIGSFMGISLVVWATRFRRYSALGEMVSVDPYFDSGYTETLPWNNEKITKWSTPRVMEKAMALYARCDLPVRLIRQTTREALPRLMADGRRFDVIFVDGNHEGLHPLFDLAAAISLARSPAYVILDDINWPDVAPIKALCDRHLAPIAASPAKACYRID